MPINMTDYKMIVHERVMVDTDEMHVFCRNQCANVKCTKHISKAYECGGACSMQLLRGQPECAGYISRRKRK